MIGKILELERRFLFDGLFLEEHNECYKGTTITDDVHNLVQRIVRKSKVRWKNVTMVWIDNKTIYDMVSQTWIINMISYKEIKFINEAMNSWKVELTVEGKKIN